MLHEIFKNFCCSLSDLQLCGSPRPIRNGDFIFSSQSGKLTVLYSCYHGFKLEGAAEIVCEGNQWSNEAPRCTCEWMFLICFVRSVCSAGRVELFNMKDRFHRRLISAESSVIEVLRSETNCMMEARRLWRLRPLRVGLYCYLLA